jgi:hypothetical protein
MTPVGIHGVRLQFRTVNVFTRTRSEVELA